MGISCAFWVDDFWSRDAGCLLRLEAKASSLMNTPQSEFLLASPRNLKPAGASAWL
jgi:hypothetical protein